MKLMYTARHDREHPLGIMVVVRTSELHRIAGTLKYQWKSMEESCSFLPIDTSKQDLNHYKKVMLEATRQKDLMKECV